MANSKLENLKRIMRYRIPHYHKRFPLILFWSQKSGCTSLAKWFFFQIGKLEEATQYHPWIHNYEFEIYKKQRNYKREVIRGILGSRKAAYKLVRNPYHRAVSSFLVLSGNGPVAQREWGKIREFFYKDKNIKKGISFKQFLYYVLEVGSDIRGMDGHFSQQYVDGEEDFITDYLYLEKFIEMISIVEKKYGLVKSPLASIIESDHHFSPSMVPMDDFSDTIITEGFFSDGTFPHYRSFYNDETKSLIEQVFKKDFEVYDYKKM